MHQASLGGTVRLSCRMAIERAAVTCHRCAYADSLATDYCIQATALDGIASGFEVILVEDCIRGVAPGTTRSALEEMRRAGVETTTAAAISTAVALAVATGTETEPPSRARASRS